MVVREPEHLEARSEALYGAWLGGAALAAVGMALHHKLCHVLGGTFDLPHAEVHTIVLPHATAYNRAGAPAAMARIAQALGAEDAAEGLLRPRRRARRQAGLAEIGLREEDLDRAADLAVESPYPNPTPLTRDRHPRPARRRFPRATAGGLTAGLSGGPSRWPCSSYNCERQTWTHSQIFTPFDQ